MSTMGEGMLAAPGPSMSQFLTAVGDAFARYEERLGRVAEAIYMAPDRFGYLLGLRQLNDLPLTDKDLAGMAIVVSSGLSSGTIAIGPYEIADASPAMNRAERRAAKKRKVSNKSRTSDEHGAIIELDARGHRTRYELVEF